MKIIRCYLDDNVAWRRRSIEDQHREKNNSHRLWITLKHLCLLISFHQMEKNVEWDGRGVREPKPWSVVDTRESVCFWCGCSFVRDKKVSPTKLVALQISFASNTFQLHFNYELNLFLMLLNDSTMILIKMTAGSSLLNWRWTLLLWNFPVNETSTIYIVEQKKLSVLAVNIIISTSNQ